MPKQDRFKQSIIAVLAKRSANQCANPDCGAITSGPSARKRTASVNVGEAAHIYGASPTSARYDPAMSSQARSDITNAIWLCGNCHKLVDDDEVKYPAGLLFEWQRSHEEQITQQVGKAGRAARRRYEERHLEELGKLSYLAERIVVEKGDLWEYRLTAEVLRSETAPIIRRWDALKRGLYSRPRVRLAKEECLPWVQDRLIEARLIAGAFGSLINHEFARAWGAPGVAGSDADIVSTCRLFAEACESALQWEEMVRFTSLHEVFEEVQGLLTGVVGHMIDETAKVPSWLTDTISKPNVSGTHSLDLVLRLPDGWNEMVDEALERVADGYHD